MQICPVYPSELFGGRSFTPDPHCFKGMPLWGMGALSGQKEEGKLEERTLSHLP